jgi:hypothetical protein
LAGTTRFTTWRHSERLPVRKINEADDMPVAYDDGMQKVLDADDIPARIHTFVSKVSDPAAGVA